jgi:hypothetical protein
MLWVGLPSHRSPPLPAWFWPRGWHGDERPG